MLLSYHAEHGAFPPANYKAKPDGPIHSWRVLLVPYTDMYFKERYMKYDFSQEWCSANNLRALGPDSGFDYYSTLGEHNGITNYLTMNEEDEWPSTGPLTSIVVTKGKDHFLVIECPESRINWMEPKN
jgi:hypothetical protein